MLVGLSLSLVMTDWILLVVECRVNLVLSTRSCLLGDVPGMLLCEEAVSCVRFG